MSINPLFNASQVHLSQQTQQTTAQKSGGSQPSDSVQLSSAALNKLQGGDTDGDGDGH